MTNLVNQPTAWPTRKMMVFAIAGVATALVQSWVGELSQVHPLLSALDKPVVSEALPVIVGGCVAYFFRERAT